MKIIIFDYLSVQDYNNPPYKSAEKEIYKNQVLRCNNIDDFNKEIEKIGILDESTILTILSHGHVRGITKGTYETLITWCELIEIVNRCKGGHILKLNLLAICNSDNIQISANFCNHKIDEFWITSNETFSIFKSLLALKEETFESFIYNLEDEEKSLYGCYKYN
jgi:hypothetical protein